MTNITIEHPPPPNTPWEFSGLVAATHYRRDRSLRFAVLQLIHPIIFTLLDKDAYIIWLDRYFNYVSCHVRFGMIRGVVVY